MRRTIFGIAATIVIATSVSAQHQLPYGSRVGMNITVVRSGGVGSETAFAEIVHTRENAREFCTNYLNDNSQKCVEENLSIGVKSRISANCVNGTFYDAFGVRFQFRGPNLNKSDQNDTEYIIFSYSDNAALCSAAACGYDERLITFAFLCPNRVSVPRIEVSQSPDGSRIPIDGLFEAWRTLDARLYISQWAPNGIKIDLRNGSRQTPANLLTERSRLFSQLAAVDVQYEPRLERSSGNEAVYRVSYRLSYLFKDGRRFSEKACENYLVRYVNGMWLIVRNEDYAPCF